MEIPTQDEIQLDRWCYHVEDGYAYKYVGHGIFLVFPQGNGYQIKYSFIGNDGNTQTWRWKFLNSILEIPKFENEFFHKLYPASDAHSFALANRKVKEGEEECPN